MLIKGVFFSWLMKAMWQTRGRDGRYNLESVFSVDVASKLADGPTADRTIDISKPKTFSGQLGKLWTECLYLPPHPPKFI